MGMERAAKGVGQVFADIAHMADAVAKETGKDRSKLTGP